VTAVEAHEPLVITEPGLYPEIPHDVYLADPVLGGSLSHSGAKTIVNKTPALFAYERENGRANKRAYDIGHAAHQIVLGVGPAIEIVQKVTKDGTKVDATDYQTKSAQDFRDAAYLRGAVPILRHEYEATVAMADAIRQHPIASKLLAPGSGQPEASAFARDADSGIWLRCRYDYLRRPLSTGRLLLVDYKTADDASDEAFAKSAANYGYAIQDYFYSHIAELLGLADDIAFLFVAQEKHPPYLVNVIQLDAVARRIGAHLGRRAIETYRACTASGEWPGYPSAKPAIVPLPHWYERRFEDQLS
jgi:hypothetical protein